MTKLLTESDFKSLCLEYQLERIKRTSREEKFLSNLPYHEDMVKIYNQKSYYNDYSKDMAREVAFVVSFVLTIKLAPYYYPGRISHLKYLLFFPKVFIPFSLLISLRYSILPDLAPLAEGEFENIKEEQLLYQILQEKTDIYDSVDYILDLKEKYSLYELNQLKKEEKERNYSIIMDKFKEYERI